MPDVSGNFTYDHRFQFKDIPEARLGGCHADVYLPKTAEGAPVAFVIHGGGYTVGASSNIPMEQVKYLLNLGFVVVSPEYRLAPHANQFQSREDCLDAYKWVMKDLSGLLGVKLDTTRVISLGGSAGGTSSLFLGIDAIDNSLQPLRAIMAFYPLTDANSCFGRPLEEFEAALTPEELEANKRFMAEPVETSAPFTKPRLPNNPRNTWLEQMFRLQTLNAVLMGQNPPFPPNCSVNELITPKSTPTFIIVAEADKLIPNEQSYKLYDVLKANGVDCALAVAKGMDHGQIEAPKEVWPEGVDWWLECVKPGLDWIAEKARRG